MSVVYHQGRAFDRVPHWDERNHLIASMQHPESSVLSNARRTRHWTIRNILDQGSLGSCVGNGCAHFCEATPRAQPNINEDIAVRLYREAQDRDEWPGRNYEGTSLLGGMKALQYESRISSYLWITSTDEMALTIGYISPVIIAVTWKQDMMDTDDAGMIHATGADVGGHCVCVSGYNDKTKRFTIAQSWGTGWGRKGFCEISETDMASLLHNQGECAVARKLVK